mmetsp:Transcript_25543/g.73457  ORF Transcript_25543/g.73457 Transcript_25543/m.73457 type:complete len:384 (+) Transcript_25543:2202-3353(+)
MTTATRASTHRRSHRSASSRSPAPRSRNHFRQSPDASATAKLRPYCRRAMAVWRRPRTPPASGRDSSRSAWTSARSAAATASPPTGRRAIASLVQRGQRPSQCSSKGLLPRTSRRPPPPLPPRPSNAARPATGNPHGSRTTRSSPSHGRGSFAHARGCRRCGRKTAPGANARRRRKCPRCSSGGSTRPSVADSPRFESGAAETSAKSATLAWTASCQWATECATAAAWCTPRPPHPTHRPPRSLRHRRCRRSWARCPRLPTRAPHCKPRNSHSGAASYSDGRHNNRRPNQSPRRRLSQGQCHRPPRTPASGCSVLATHPHPRAPRPPNGAGRGCPERWLPSLAAPVDGYATSRPCAAARCVPLWSSTLWAATPPRASLSKGSW